MEMQPAEELLKKIQRLEAGHVPLLDEMSNLMLSTGLHHTKRRAHSVSPQRRPRSLPSRDDGRALLRKGSVSFSASPNSASPLQRDLQRQYAIQFQYAIQ